MLSTELFEQKYSKSPYTSRTPLVRGEMDRSPFGIKLPLSADLICIKFASYNI